MLVDKLIKIRSSMRNATSASLIVIAAFAMYRWTVTPHAASLSSAKTYESIADNLIKQRKLIATNLKVKQKKLEQLQQESVQLVGTLFTPNAAREFFSDIEVISEQTGCAVHAINLLADGEGNEYGHLGIRIKSAELTVVALYRDIARLIRRLQERSQKVWLDSMEIRAINVNSDKVACSLTITICETFDKDTP
ncbi:MAG: type 4a pilus biogenesis protein PilO [Planctomycetota bacterium]|jgi:Tfp pilus assembly protein PilO